MYFQIGQGCLRANDQCCSARMPCGHTYRPTAELSDWGLEMMEQRGEEGFVSVSAKKAFFSALRSGPGVPRRRQQSTCRVIPPTGSRGPPAPQRRKPSRALPARMLPRGAPWQGLRANWQPRACPPRASGGFWAVLTELRGNENSGEEIPRGPWFSTAWDASPLVTLGQGGGAAWAGV